MNKKRIEIIAIIFVFAVFILKIYLSVNNKPQVQNNNPVIKEQKKSDTIIQFDINDYKIPKSDNSTYAKNNTKFKTEYDEKAIDTISLISIMNEYYNKTLSNKEYLNLAFELYKKEININNKYKKYDTTKDVILFKDLNDISLYFFNKQLVSEDIEGLYRMENEDVLYKYYKELNGYKYNDSYSHSHGYNTFESLIRYQDSIYNEDNKQLKITVNEAYAICDFGCDAYYYSLDTINKEDYLLLKTKYENEEINIDYLYSDLYNLPVEKLQTVTYTFDVSKNIYTLLNYN